MDLLGRHIEGGVPPDGPGVYHFTVVEPLQATSLRGSSRRQDLVSNGVTKTPICRTNDTFRLLCECGPPFLGPSLAELAGRYQHRERVGSDVAGQIAIYLVDALLDRDPRWGAPIGDALA